ncbi:MAG: PilN domain-containing protein [Actinomycetia bacterium]|nr:PilN domain-containing protein [Actinomycetes bacterium]
MTTLTPTRLAQMPRVNLLPPEIAAAARFKQLRVMLGAIVLGSVVLLVLAFLFTSSRIGAAEDSLVQSQAAGARLDKDISSYAEVPQVLGAVDSAQTNLATAMTPEIRWSFYMNDLSLTIPRTTRLTKLEAVNLAADAQLTGALTGQPLTPEGAVSVGSVTFSGKSTDFDAVASWLQTLAKQKGFLEPSVQNVTFSTADTTGSFYDVESNTQLSLEALSGRAMQIANGE